MKIAILIDGGFYKKRAKTLYGEQTPEKMSEELIKYCYKHIEDDNELYKIFYYDCPPLNKKMNHPLNNRQIDLKKTDIYRWNEKFISLMMQKRK